jgi:nucleoside 2-deoxyribosyltransferase
MSGLRMPLAAGSSRIAPPSNAAGGPVKEEARRPRIYLAGPDVFFAHSARIFAALAAHCERLGLQALVPTDGGPPEGGAEAGVDTDEALAQRIYEGNVALIRSADGVIANLCCFRGQEPDSGTVFEVGFAIAAGKPVVAYGVPEGSYAERVAAAIPCRRGADGLLREASNDTQVEGLAQRLNLMLSRSTPIAPNAEAALEMLAARLGTSRPSEAL